MCDGGGCKWCMGDVGRQAPLHTSQKRGKGGEVACGGSGAGGGGVALERGLVGSDGGDVDDNGHAHLFDALSQKSKTQARKEQQREDENDKRL
jgi:hypothetical protein